MNNINKSIIINIKLIDFAAVRLATQPEAWPAGSPPYPTAAAMASCTGYQWLWPCHLCHHQEILTIHSHHDLAIECTLVHINVIKQVLNTLECARMHSACMWMLLSEHWMHLNVLYALWVHMNEVWLTEGDWMCLSVHECHWVSIGLMSVHISGWGNLKEINRAGSNWIQEWNGCLF